MAPRGQPGCRTPDEGSVPSAGCTETWAGEALSRSGRSAPPHLTAAETQVNAHTDGLAAMDVEGGQALSILDSCVLHRPLSRRAGRAVRAGWCPRLAAIAVTGHRLPVSIWSTSCVPGSECFPGEH